MELAFIWLGRSNTIRNEFGAEIIVLRVLFIKMFSVFYWFLPSILRGTCYIHGADTACFKFTGRNHTILPVATSVIITLRSFISSKFYLSLISLRKVFRLLLIVFRPKRKEELRMTGMFMFQLRKTYFQNAYFSKICYLRNTIVMSLSD